MIYVRYLVAEFYDLTFKRFSGSVGVAQDAVNHFACKIKDVYKRQGINCIVYADGRRVNIADYVRMALRTTSTRATLQGAAKRFAELGYDTVLISQYGGC